MERFVGQKVLIVKNDKVEGVIKEIDQEEGLLTIETAAGERLFGYVSILNDKVVFVDEKVQAIAKPFFDLLNQDHEEAKEAKEDKAVEEIKNRDICRIRRDLQDSNVAFKCTFCNGGCSNTCIGFKGPCSPELREYNVKNHEWCSSFDCRCRKLEDGEISQEEFDGKLNTEERMEFLCYESKMLVDWVCYAGMEKKTGLPMALNKAQVGSLAVMTVRPVIDGEEVPQEKTQIFGVFLIAKHDDKSSIGGSVSAHPKYRIELTPKESEKVLFWKFHANAENPTKPFWGTGLHRYLNDMECCQILREIANVVEDQNKKELALELLAKFQTETGITIIEEPKGAIK